MLPCLPVCNVLCGDFAVILSRPTAARVHRQGSAKTIEARLHRRSYVNGESLPGRRLEHDTVRNKFNTATRANLTSARAELQLTCYVVL